MSLFGIALLSILYFLMVFILGAFCQGVYAIFDSTSALEFNILITFSIPSAARYLSENSEVASPPVPAQARPIIPVSEIGSGSVISLRFDLILKYISLIGRAPLTADFSTPIGFFM